MGTYWQGECGKESIFGRGRRWRKAANGSVWRNAAAKPWRFLRWLTDLRRWNFPLPLHPSRMTTFSIRWCLLRDFKDLKQSAKKVTKICKGRLPTSLPGKKMWEKGASRTQFYGPKLPLVLICAGFTFSTWMDTWSINPKVMPLLPLFFSFPPKKFHITKELKQYYRSESSQLTIPPGMQEILTHPLILNRAANLASKWARELERLGNQTIDHSKCSENTIRRDSTMSKATQGQLFSRANSIALTAAKASSNKWSYSL